MTRLAVIYATVGRPEVVREAIERLGRQTRLPDLVVISVVDKSDASDADKLLLRPEVVVGSKGLCAQRNRGLAHVADRADIVLFLDDDFLPADDYIAEAVALFERMPELGGATGWVIADGIKTSGYSFADAAVRLAAHQPRDGHQLHHRDALYGCNMAIRRTMVEGIWFDENLPLYAWLEDIDFTYRLSRRYPMVQNDKMVGVHLGVKGGRTSGKRLGYSQIANPIYMLRKRSAPPQLALKNMIGNILSNSARSLRPEPYVDRRGRLMGNLIALKDLLLSRLDTKRVLTLD